MEFINYKGSKVEIEDLGTLALALLDAEVPFSKENITVIQGLFVPDELKLGDEFQAFIADMADGYADGDELKGHRNYLSAVQELTDLMLDATAESGKTYDRRNYWLLWEQRMTRNLRHEMAIIEEYLKPQDKEEFRRISLQFKEI